MVQVATETRPASSRGSWLGSTVLAVSGVLVALGVTTWVSAFQRVPGWSGPLVAVIVAAGIGTAVSRSGGWRHRPLWLGALGVALVALGSGLGRPRRSVGGPGWSEGELGGGAILGRLDTWWAVVGGGAVLVLGALAWSVVLSRRPGGTGPVAAGSALALLGLGLVVLTVTMRDIVVGHWVSGRPLRRPGRPPAVPAASGRSDAAGVHVAPPAAGRPAPDHPPGGPPGAVGELWRDAGDDEAAAVVAFEDLAVRLARAGAPAALVDRCRAAARDEARHARQCDLLATRWGAAPRARWLPTGAEGPGGPDPRPLGPVARRAELIRLAVESLVDGVVGESFAADRLEAGAAGTGDGATARVLRAMAAEERGHARLAADIVAWCRAEFPSLVGPALHAASRRLPATALAPPGHAAASPAALVAAGLVTPADAAALWASVVPPRPDAPVAAGAGPRAVGRAGGTGRRRCPG